MASPPRPSKLPHPAWLLAAFTCLLLPGVVAAGVLDVRSYDGSGNNLANPDWGQAGSQLLRMQPAAYPGDGSGDVINVAPDRPNPRDISNRLATQDSSVTANSYGMSSFLWQWGQFIDHDITLTHSSSAFGTAPIPVTDPADPFYNADPALSVMPLSRSEYASGTGTPGVPREQVNAISAYIDASNVYGSDQATADGLRTFSGGLLQTSSGDLLPTVTMPNPMGGPDMTVFIAGDERANEQVGLTAMHTVFVREHNRLATALAAADPSLNDEQIYQTARKIVGAELQKITYEEFLPTLLGGMAPLIGPGDYAPTVNAGIVNEFSTALYRFGHTMLPANFELRDDSGQIVSTLALRDAFFNPNILLSDPSILDQVLRGLAGQPAQQIDNMLVDDVRNFLFGAPGMGGLDLATMNIQRGRDHGLASYNDVRMAYGLAPVSSFDQISSDPLLVQALRDLYGVDATGADNIDAIDLWVAGLAETHLAGAAVGELIAAALLDQFTRLAVGDSFFYLWDLDLLSNPDITAVIDMSEVTLGTVLAWNTGMQTLQADVFAMTEVPAPAVIWLLFAGLLGTGLLRQRPLLAT